MARFAEVFMEQAERTDTPKIRTRKIQFIHYTKLIDSAYQYRSRDREMILSLADLIKADGEILEPCIVRKSGAGSDSFELIAGHKRTLAAKYLVEEEKLEEFVFIPCIVKTFSDIRAEFAVYSTNGYDEKTPYEIMREIEGMSRLLKEYPEEFPEFAGKGRLVEKLAAKMKMSRSVISDYQNISHNLGERGMQSFKEGKIDKSAAVTLASMPKDKQEEALGQGLTKREEIKKYAAGQVKEPSGKKGKYLTEGAYKEAEKKKTDHPQEAERKEDASNETEPEENIFGLTVGELLNKISIRNGSIKITSPEKSFVWCFRKESNEFILEQDKEKEEEVLPGQMNVEEFL